MQKLRTKFRKGELLLVGLIVVSFAISLLGHCKLPAEIATNWRRLPDNEWIVGRSGPRFMGTFAVSLFLLVLFAVYWILPRLLRRPEDVRYRYYDRLVIWLFAVELFAQVYLLSGNLGFYWQLDGHVAFCLFMGPGLFLLGDTLVHARPGWLISWPSAAAKQSPEIWGKTHRTTGRIMKLAGILAAPSALLPSELGMALMGIPVALGSLFMLTYPIIASYRLKRDDGGSA